MNSVRNLEIAARDAPGRCPSPTASVLGDDYSFFFDHWLGEDEFDNLQRLNPLPIREYKAGEIVFEEGVEGHEAFFIKMGEVSISALSGDGGRKELALLRAGDLFGEMAVIEDIPRSGTAAALSDCEVYVISREYLLALLERSPAVGMRVLRELSRRMRLLNQRHIEEAREVERVDALGRIIRSLAHDLKNSLAGIGIASDVICKPNTSASHRQKYGDVLARKLKRMRTLIDELSAFASASSAPCNRSTFNFRAFIEEIVQESEPEAQKYGIRIVRLNDPPEASLDGDTERLFRVFSNVIRNAFDQMPDGGTLKLGFHETERGVLTQVEDTGGGIAAEILPKMFEPFSTFGKADGTGLGLAICLRILKEHGGDIRAFNRSEGAVIECFLPKSRANSGQAIVSR